MGRKGAQGRKPNPTLAKARSQRQGNGNNSIETLKTGVTFSIDPSLKGDKRGDLPATESSSTFLSTSVALSNLQQTTSNTIKTRKEHEPVERTILKRLSTNSSDGDDNDCDSSDEENETKNVDGNNSSNRNTKRFLAQMQLRQQMTSSTLTWRRSTSLLDTTRKKNQLNLTTSSLLDSAIQVDEDKMTWRKEMLSNRFIEDDLMEGIRFLNKPDSAFKNPLQQAIPFKQIESGGRRGLSRSGSDSSLNSTTSMNSVASVFSTISLSFLAFTRTRSNYLESGNVASRRFIDFTPYRDIDDNDNEDDDDNGDIYEPPKAPETNDDDIFSITSSYSIQVRNPKVEPSGKSKIARNFLDLTLDHSMRGDSLTGHLNSVKILLPITQEDDEPEIDEIEPYTHISNIHKGEGADDKTRALNVDNEGDDVSTTSVDSEQIDVFTSDAWERADDAFIKGVHEVAHLLERNLMIKGCESPYWNFDEIVSQFDQIHLKMKENIDRCILEQQECLSREARGKLETAKHKNALRQVTEQAGKVMLPAIKFSQQAGMAAIQPAVMITNQAGIAMKKIGQKLNFEHDVPSGQEHTPSSSVETTSETIGLDDFREGFRWRNEREFVRNFLYEKRHDYSVTLPSVLAKGLEKRLSEATTFVAVGIIDELTSPLHKHRESIYSELTSTNPTEASSPAGLDEHEHHRTPFYSTAVMALFGTSTIKSHETHNVTIEDNVPATSPSTDPVNGRSESAPIERLNLLERHPSLSSLMTTESTDNHAWLLAGSTPAPA